MGNPKFKIGDKLICIDPYGNSIRKDGARDNRGMVDKNHAGWGWEPYKYGVVMDITYAINGEPVYWFESDGWKGGVYERFLKIKKRWSFKRAVYEKYR